MRKLLSLLIFLYACNGAAQNKAAIDSTATTVKTDSTAAVVAPAAKRLTVEVASITQRELIATGTDTRPVAGTAVSAAWKGTYAAVLDKDSKDSRDHINIEFKVEGDSVIYTESGFQVYSKYALTAAEKNGLLLFSFKKVLDGGSAVLEKEERFGYIRKENGKYYLECPYLDVRTGAGKKEIYPLDKQ